MNIVRKITRTFDNSGEFSIDEHRYDAIVSQSEHPADWIDSALFYDWDNADDHQEWLDDAEISEIVSWVDDVVDSWE